MAEEEDWKSSGEAVLPEYQDFPGEGYLAYDPNTLVISPNRDGHRPVNHPIELVGKFVGTEQPMIPTCAKPGPGVMGCNKWHGCKIGQKYRGVGPGYVVMKKLGTVSFARCYDYFETTRGGRPTTQLHYGLEGWKLDTSRTTIDVLGSTPIMNPLGQTVATKKSVWQMEIAGLLPPWWPLMKEKNLPLPASAKRFPAATKKAVKKKAAE